MSTANLLKVRRTFAQPGFSFFQENMSHYFFSFFKMIALSCFDSQNDSLFGHFSFLKHLPLELSDYFKKTSYVTFCASFDDLRIL